MIALQTCVTISPAACDQNQPVFRFGEQDKICKLSANILRSVLPFLNERMVGKVARTNKWFCFVVKTSCLKEKTRLVNVTDSFVEQFNKIVDQIRVRKSRQMRAIIFKKQSKKVKNLENIMSEIVRVRKTDLCFFSCFGKTMDFGIEFLKEMAKFKESDWIWIQERMDLLIQQKPKSKIETLEHKGEDAEKRKFDVITKDRLIKIKYLINQTRKYQIAIKSNSAQQVFAVANELLNNGGGLVFLSCQFALKSPELGEDCRVQKNAFLERVIDILLNKNNPWRAFDIYKKYSLAEDEYPRAICLLQLSKIISLFLKGGEMENAYELINFHTKFPQIKDRMITDCFVDYFLKKEKPEKAEELVIEMIARNVNYTVFPLQTSRILYDAYYENPRDKAIRAIIDFYLRNDNIESALEFVNKHSLDPAKYLYKISAHLLAIKHDSLSKTYKILDQMAATDFKNFVKHLREDIILEDFLKKILEDGEINLATKFLNECLDNEKSRILFWILKKPEAKVLFAKKPAEDEKKRS